MLPGGTRYTSRRTGGWVQIVERQARDGRDERRSRGLEDDRDPARVPRHYDA